MDDDSSSLQSQDTDKLPDTPTSLAKISRDSKESTPTPSETSSTSALQKSSSDVAIIIEKKKLDKEDSNESDVSNESDKKVLRKEGKGKAPPPPPAVIAVPPTPPVTPTQTEKHLVNQATQDIEAITKESADMKPKKDQAPIPPAPVLPVAAGGTAFILPPTIEDEQEITKSLAESEETKVNVVVSTSITTTTTTQDTIVSVESTNSNIIPINDIPPPLAFASSTPNKMTANNTSTITINSNTPPTTTTTTGNDNSNSLNQLQTSVNQVTVVTSHPPVIIDNSVIISDPSNEVIIVSNETNKTHVNESSTDDDYPSLDSLESPKSAGVTVSKSDKKSKEIKGRKLDESEVLIVSPFAEDIEEVNEDEDNEVDSKFDTSHVSVVTVGEENVQVRDSSNVKNIDNSSSDLTQIPETPEDEYEANGEVPFKSSPKEDVSLIVNNKKRPNKQRISPDSSVGSMDSRAQSESGSIRSAGVVNVNKIDRSDAESIATTASHDSREPEDDVIVRRKMVEAQIRSKEEIQLRNLRKKTRKRTRKFEIDGVQVTTTTSKVIYGDEENGKMYDDHILRKQELRELKLLQKQEKKQFDELQLKEQAAREQQEKRFEQVGIIYLINIKHRMFIIFFFSTGTSCTRTYI